MASLRKVVPVGATIWLIVSVTHVIQVLFIVSYRTTTVVVTSAAYLHPGDAGNDDL